MHEPVLMQPWNLPTAMVGLRSTESIKAGRVLHEDLSKFSQPLKELPFL